MNRFKQKLDRGEHAIGTHVSLRDLAITEILGGSGFDYLWIDTEHTALDLECVQNHLIAAKSSNVSAIIRVPWNDPVRVKPILEMGPDGIVFPQISSYEEAQLAVRSCMYPPQGIRGFGPRRAIGYGLRELSEYLDNVDNELLRLIQIENIQAVNDLDRILTVEGVSGLVIGPCDLAASMGYLHEVEHRDVLRMMEIVVKKANSAHVPVGMSIGSMTESMMRFWYENGLDFLSVGGDTHFLFTGAKTLALTLKRNFANRDID